MADRNVRSWFRKGLDQGLSSGDLADAFYRRLFENHLLPMGIYDAKTLHFLDVNQAAVEAYGYLRQEWLEMRLADICLEQDAKHLLRELRAQGSSHYAGKVRHRRKDGQIIEVEMTLQVLEVEKRRVGLMTIRKLEREREGLSDLLSVALEALADPVIITDAKGYIEWVNSAFLELNDYRLDEVLGKRPADLVKSGRQNPEFYQQMWRAILSWEAWRGELINRRQDGTLYWVEMTITPIVDAGGKVVHFVAVQQEITQRKQAEQALRESEERYRKLIDQLPGVVYLDVLDGKGTTLFVSSQITSLLGVSMEEWLQGDLSLWLSLIHPEDRQRVRETYFRAYETGQPCNLEYRVITRDGRLLWIQEEERILHTERGEILLQGVMFDVTDRKRAEEQYRLLFERAIEGIYQSTPEGRFLVVNPALARMLGYDSPQDLTQSVDNIALQVYVNPAQRQEFVRLLEERGEVRGYEYQARRKDGSTLWVSENARLVRGPDGKVWYYEGNVQDITERKQAEAQRERLLQILELSLNEIYTFDRTTLRFEYVNRSAQANLGYSLDQLRHMTPIDIKPCFDEKSFRELLRPLEEGQQKLVVFETVHRRADGSEYPVEVHVQLLSQEEPVYLAVIFDITERKKAEQALQERDRLLREAQRIAGLGSYMLDIPSGIWQSSEMLDRIFGIDESYPHSVQGWLELVHPEDRERMARYFQEEVLGKGQSFDQQYRILPANDRQERWVHGLGQLEFDSAGRPVKMYGTIQDITERKRYERELEAQVILAQALGETWEVEPLLEYLLNAACHAVPVAEKGSVLLCEANGQLRIRALKGYYDPRLRNFAFASNSGYAARVARLRQPMIVSDARADPEIRYDGEIEEARQIFSAIAVPLMIGERLIGVMSLDSTKRAAFSQEDLKTLNSFATLAALILERAQLFEEARRRLIELEMLYESGLALSQLLTPKEIGQKLIELLAQKMDWHHTAVRLYHPESDSFELLAFNQPGLETAADWKATEQLFRTKVSRPNQGLSGWAFQQGRVIRLGEVSDDPHYVETFPGVRSGLYVPLRLGDQKLGVISIENIQPNAFDEADERLVATLANQAAIALENARLFEEIRQRAFEQEVIHRASQMLLTAQLEPSAVYQAIHQAVLQLMPCEAFVIVLNDEENGDEYEAVYLYDRGVRYPPQRVPKGQGLSGRVISAGRSLIIHDMLVEELPGPHFGSEEPVRSILAVPLRRGDRIIGMISTQSYLPGVFTDQHLVLLETLAAQMTVVIENARLFDETRRRVHELEMINRVSVALRVISTQDEMLAVVLEEILFALNAPSGSINLLDEKNGVLLPSISRGWIADLSEGLIRPGEGMCWTVLEQGEPYLSQEFASDPLILPQIAERLPRGWGGACVPIHSFEKMLGVIVIAIPSERKLTNNEIRLLSTLAEMTGNALHRMRLYENTKRRAEEFALLYEINLAIAQQHDLTSLLNLIGNAARDLAQADAGGIYLYDSSQQQLEMAASSHPSAPIGTRLRLGEGLAGLVAQSRSPMRVDDYSAWEYRSKAYERTPIQAALHVPMLFGGELIGVLWVHELDDSRRVFSDRDEHLLSLLATQAAAAVRSARLRMEIERRLQHLQALREVDRTISASFDLHIILNTVLNHTILQLGVDAADVLLFNPLLHTLTYAHGLGFRTPLIERTSLRLGEGMAGQAALERRVTFVPDFQQAGSGYTRFSLVVEEGFRAYCCVPLVSKGDLKGVLEVFHRSPLPEQPGWLDLLETLARQAAIAIDNLQLFERMQRSNAELLIAYEATLEGWSRAITLRDEETEEHTRRVTDLTVALAQAVGLSDEEIVHIRRGALLHDIGKIGVPDSILRKPGPLTEGEWAIMRRHPSWAYEMLQPIAYLRRALEIPYLHHERWDGSGYPLGLRGEQIPISARIFAVVDMFDALTSDRPYRKAWSREEALEYIRQQSGKALDPYVVDVFLRLIERWE